MFAHPFTALDASNFTFTAGQIVRGVRVGRFMVVDSERSRLDSKEIVTVRELGPQGQLATENMRFPADMLVAE